MANVQLVHLRYRRYRLHIVIMQAVSGIHHQPARGIIDGITDTLEFARHLISIRSLGIRAVELDIRLAGEALVESVLAQVEGRPPNPRVLPARLVVRASSGG